MSPEEMWTRFAAAALQGLLDRSTGDAGHQHTGDGDGRTNAKYLTAEAAEYADAMLAKAFECTPIGDDVVDDEPNTVDELNTDWTKGKN